MACWIQSGNLEKEFFSSDVLKVLLNDSASCVMVARASRMNPVLPSAGVAGGIIGGVEAGARRV